MTNIWEFLLMTLTCSLTAMLLLIIKKVFADKLSPRWQYGIWSILALRMVLPVAVYNRYVLLPLPQWIENIKFAAESRLTSSYSSAFMPISEPWFFPYVAHEAQAAQTTQTSQMIQTPASITDYLFILYMAGIIITLAIYLISYIKLRHLISKGSAIDANSSAVLAETCSKYGLKSCPAVELDGLTSAFVCGILKPVLVLPKGAVTDEKVILHEMLHLRYHDALQSIIWSVFSALHWCNPFMRYIFRIIGNDMEALCDQRVLERIEGEERREYGKILLFMANESYPRAFGTTSISNGGKNIAKRISCIANFKKYPRGMALVSICIAVILLQPILFGSTAHGVPAPGYAADRDTAVKNLQRDLAVTRVTRCTTIAGAIDTFAKGLVYSNGFYLATALPLDKQEELYSMMVPKVQDSVTIDSPLNEYEPFTTEDYVSGFRNGFYGICNLRKSASCPGGLDGELAIMLGPKRSVKAGPSSGENNADENNTDEVLPSVAVFTITISKENQSYVISQCSEPVIKVADTKRLSDQLVLSCIDPIKTYTGQGTLGKSTAPLHIIYTIENPAPPRNVWIQYSDFYDYTAEPITNAEFKTASVKSDLTYKYTGKAEDLKDISYVTIESQLLEAGKIIPPDINEAFDDSDTSIINIAGGGSSNTGWSWYAQTFKEEPWNGTIMDYNLGFEYFYEENIIDVLARAFPLFKSSDMASEVVTDFPEAIANRVYIDGFETDYIILQ